MENTYLAIAQKHVDAWCNDHSGTLTFYDVVLNAIKESHQPMQLSDIAVEMHAEAAIQDEKNDPAYNSNP